MSLETNCSKRFYLCYNSCKECVMLINPISNQTNFQAVNQKYYQWAKKDIKRGIGLSGEVLTQIEMKVCWHDMHPQDALDTIEAIKKLIPEWKGFELSIDFIKKFIP